MKSPYNYMYFLALLFTSVWVQAQPIELYTQFNGQYDFTAIGNTLLPVDNTDNEESSNCDIFTESSAELNLASGQDVVAAYLYWAGVGEGDFEVQLNGLDITPDRTFSETYGDQPYFGAFTDITDVVQATGNGTYTLSELDLTDIVFNYCFGGGGANTNFGGWSITIIYEDSTLPYNQVSIYDGLNRMHGLDSELNITLDNLNIVDSEGAKIGLLLWEGNSFVTGGFDSEFLYINGVNTIDPPFNPYANIYNSTNSYTGATDMWKVDLDLYSIEDLVNIGDDSIDIVVETGQDLIFVNNINITVRSELPDATIVIDDVVGNDICGNRDLEVEYTVFNTNSTAPLPAGTPISFYANASLLGTASTLNNLPVNGSESGTTTQTIPGAIPIDFNLTAVVDDIGDGTGIVAETNEDNNVYTLPVSLTILDEFPTLYDLESCGLVGTHIFDLYDATVDVGVDMDVDFYYTLEDAEDEVDEITDPTNFVNDTPPQTIYIRIRADECYYISSITVNTLPIPNAINPTPLEVCDELPEDGFTFFSLHDKDDEITGSNPDYEVLYFETLPLAETGDLDDAIDDPYQNTTANNQTVYARVNDTSNGCHHIVLLALVVEPLPTLTDPAPLQVCDDLPEDGFTFFDLHDKDDEITGSNPNYDVLYFETLAESEVGDPDTAISDPYQNTTIDAQTVFVRVNDITNGCHSLTTLDIEVLPLPDPLLDIPNYELCDDDENSTAVFDLTTKTDEILNGLPAASYTVTYYVTEDQANAGTPEIGTPGAFISAGQTIYTRVENNVTGCYLVVSFEIIVNPLPIPEPADTIIVCDLNDDGLATFYLPVAEAQLVGAQTDITVTYYTTLAGAEDGTLDQIADPNFYVNEETPVQTIYVRLENDITGCYQTSSFLIEVRPVDFIPFELEDFEYCVTADSDIGIPLDLTEQEPYIFGTEDPSDYTVTYHLTQGEAAAGTGAFPDPTNYLNIETPQVIWVRLVNNVVNCVEIGDFTVQVYLNPVVTAPEDMTIYELCDDLTPDGMTDAFDLYTKIPEIIGDNDDVDITFHDSQEDAENDVDHLPIEDYTNIVPYLQTIYVRVEDPATGCVVYTTFDLIVNENPPILGAGPLTFCDPDNDGFGEFDLTDADDAITGGNPDLVVSYHDTPENAGSGTLPITGIYNNLEPYIDEVHVRIVNTVTGCITVTTLALEVLDTPQIIDPEPLIGCDDNGDGVVIFDLTEVEPEVFANYGDTWPNDYTIAYYETQEDADDGIDPIDPATAYPNIDAPSQTIYIVVEDIDNGCQKQTTLKLMINDVPAIFEPDPLELCDYNNPGDGIEEFDLSQAIPQITGGDTSIAISFHLTQDDADNDVAPLPLDYENAVPFAQTIFIRSYQSGTGCDNTTETLTLIVNPLPSPEEPTPLEECDTNQNGFALFDLEEKTDEILNGEDDVVITYHETFAQADEGLFPITGLYENIIPYLQTIYVRAENEITGCHTVVELELIVSDAPVVPLTIEDLIACSEDQEEFAEFDLLAHAIANDVYGSQSEDEFTLTFHLTEDDAQLGENAIADPESYTNVTNPQQIWYRLENDQSRCGNVGSFWIRVELPPAIADPIEPLELCDDEVADGITVFDLTVKNDEIALGEAGMNVQYYENEIDAIEGNEENRIDPDTEYTNLVNLQEIYVRVYDADTGCSSLGTLLLRVLPNPDINTPDPIALCDDNEPGNGSEIFDLTEHEDYIINNEVDVIVTYHTSLADAEAGENAIVDPMNYEIEEAPEQTIYVRVEYTSTGCYSIVELLLIVNPLPNIGDEEIGDYIICEINHGDTGIFNLIEKRQEILDLFAPDQTDYTVTFHEVAGDEEDGINAIPEFELEDYPNNGINPLPIYYRIEHNLTRCYITGSFNLEIREGAEATTPAEPLVACEDELGSGIATFDLTQLDDVILNGQDPVVYEVTYHESFQQALDGDAIPTPEAYQSPTQTIYARVTNNDNSSQGYCNAIVQVHLEVNPLPEVSLPESYRLCVDEDGNPIMEEFGELSPPVIDTGLDANLYTFVWLLDGSVLFGENGASISVAEAGEYTVIVTDIETGCENQASTTVTISSPPLVYGAETITPAFGNEHAIEAWVTEGLGEYIYRLDDGAYQDEGLFENVSPGVHTVTITDVNGCGSVTIEVGVIDYPLYFTPNNDTYHDTWNIIGISAFDPTAKIYVFDRYGKLLKQLSPNGPGWDGTFNGNPMPSNDYWFKVVYEEDDRQKEFSGHFTLKR